MVSAQLGISKRRKGGEERKRKLTRDLNINIVLVFASLLRIDDSDGLSDRDRRHRMHSNRRCEGHASKRLDDPRPAGEREKKVETRQSELEKVDSKRGGTHLMFSRYSGEFWLSMLLLRLSSLNRGPKYSKLRAKGRRKKVSNRRRVETHTEELA